MKKHKKMSLSDLVFDGVNYTFLILLSILCFFPFYQVVVVSISDPAVVMKKNAMLIIPEGIQFDAYRMVFANTNIISGFKNTIFYIVVGTCLGLFTTITSAYILSKQNVMFKRPIMFYFAFTNYFSGGLIPTYLLVSKMHLVNTPWAILLPGMVAVWDIIIMRTQFVNIPNELKEAAMIDGASDVTILTRILLPLSGAVLAVFLLFFAVGYWNMWFEPMIYLTKRSQYPIQSVLREILIDNDSQMMAAGSGNAAVQHKLDFKTNSAAKILLKYANIVVCTAPILAIYPFVQKYFVKGVILGSLKG